MEQNDERQEQGLDYGIYKQGEENIIAYKIEGLYEDDKGKIKKRKKLLEEPPTLRIEDYHGNVSEFLLTREFVNDMIDEMKVVKDGYLGIPKKKRYTVNDFLERRGGWKGIPLNTYILAACFIAFVFSLFIR